ncbi:MAG: IS1634 family transposase [Parachlamydiaceae bacterium]|nr:IS1634 family transposase [Parachlamydiaceae bacterium]
MYIAEIKCKKTSGKVFKTFLLRQSYRENGKVKNKTLANLSTLTEEEINLFKTFLKFKGAISHTQTSGGPVTVTPGKSIGGIAVLNEVAKRLGIVDALGTSFNGQLALWLIFARIIEQGSRLSATRLHSNYDIASVLKLKRGFDENNLYDCLHWLSDNQKSIEDALFENKKSSQQFYWYDVTSSYFEGKCNEFAAFGYNRDKKQKKRTVVIGLLCQEDGDPISIEGFKGNTQDTQTFESQLIKLKNRFNCESIIMVCDRGLIRDKQKKLLAGYNFHYITALPMSQIKPLLNKGVIKYEDFVDELKSFLYENHRYIYRRNPIRAEETKIQREERLQAVKEKVEVENRKLNKEPKASQIAAKKRIQSKLKSLYVSEWVHVLEINRQFTLTVDQEKLKEVSAFDGCYIWTTDLSKSQLSDEEVYRHYKDLKYVEDDFRSFKTAFLEIRPIHVRTKKSTEGHLLVTMLAHMILRELRKAWSPFNKTVAEILQELYLICRNTVQIGENQKIECISTPNVQMAALLKAINVEIPNFDSVDVPVVSRRKVREGVKF